MKKILTGISVTCLTVAVSAICFNTTNEQLDSSQGEPTAGTKCNFCNGTGWQGNFKCSMCNGTEANASY